LRDYQAAYWLRQMHGDPERFARIEPLRKSSSRRMPVEFLSSIRCFLHYANAATTMP